MRRSSVFAIACALAFAGAWAYTPVRHDGSYTTNGVTYAQRGGLGSADYVVTNIDANAVGKVKSVNGKDGVVTLDYSDVSALPDDQTLLEGNANFSNAVMSVSPPVELPEKWALADVTNATGGAVSAVDVGAPTRAEVEAGWWSEWVVRNHGSIITNAEILYFPASGYWQASVDDDFVSDVYGSADATYLEFPESGRYLLTTTRHRVAAPVPTKPSDIEAASLAAHTSLVAQVSIVSNAAMNARNKTDLAVYKKVGVGETWTLVSTQGSGITTNVTGVFDDGGYWSFYLDGEIVAGSYDETSTDAFEVNWTGAEKVGYSGTATRPYTYQSVTGDALAKTSDIAAAATNLVPSSRTINGKALSADIALDSSDVGAMAADAKIDRLYNGSGSRYISGDGSVYSQNSEERWLVEFNGNTYELVPRFGLAPNYWEGMIDGRLGYLAYGYDLEGYWTLNVGIGSGFDTEGTASDGYLDFQLGSFHFICTRFSTGTTFAYETRLAYTNDVAGKYTKPESGIPASDLASNSVTSVKIANSSVTTAKLSNSAVTTAKLSYGSVTDIKIADKAVADRKLSDGVRTSIPNGSIATPEDATIVHMDGDVLVIDTIDIDGEPVVETNRISSAGTNSLFTIAKATHSLAGLMTAADKAALDALAASAVSAATVTNVVDEVKELHYDEVLNVTWETRIIGGEMKFFAVTNANISVLGN